MLVQAPIVRNAHKKKGTPYYLFDRYTTIFQLLHAVIILVLSYLIFFGWNIVTRPAGEQCEAGWGGGP